MRPVKERPKPGTTDRRGRRLLRTDEPWDIGATNGKAEDVLSAPPPTARKPFVITPFNERSRVLCTELLRLCGATTKSQIGNLLGVDRGTVAHWLEGRSAVKNENLYALIEFARWGFEYRVPWWAVAGFDPAGPAIVLSDSTNAEFLCPSTWIPNEPYPAAELLRWVAGGSQGQYLTLARNLHPYRSVVARPERRDLMKEQAYSLAALSLWKLRGYRTEDISWVSWSTLEMGFHGDPARGRQTDLYRGGRLPPNPFDLLQGWGSR